tara:strand:- start:16617 stop:17150 length:534 start_codon:yes stop_codon:yes gene_type:complete
MPIAINGSGTLTGLAVGGLPDGTVDSDTLAAGTGGKILQVVTATTTTTVASSSSSQVDTGLTCSITTTTNSSKVFVTVSQPIYCRNPGGTTYSRAGVYYDLVRDSTVLQGGEQNILLWGATYSPYIVTGQMAAIVHLDTPGNAGTYAYKTTFANVDGNFKAQDNNSPAHMVLMEIAG